MPTNTDQQERSVLGGGVRHPNVSDGRRRRYGRPVYNFLKLRQPERALQFKPIALQLAFDSLLEPAPAGCRSKTTADRHLVFLSSDYALASTGFLGEFRLEGEPGPALRLGMLLDGDRCTDVQLDFNTVVGTAVPAQDPSEIRLGYIKTGLWPP